MTDLIILSSLCLGVCSVSLFFAYKFVKRSEAITEDLLDRIQFGNRPGDYILVQYERRKLKTERLQWYKKTPPLTKPDGSKPQPVDSQATSEAKKQIMEAIGKSRTDEQRRAAEIEQEAKDRRDGGFEVLS